MTTVHPLLNAHGKYFGEHFLEYGPWVELAGTVYSRMPWQFLVDVIAYEIRDVQSH